MRQRIAAMATSSYLNFDSCRLSEGENTRRQDAYRRLPDCSKAAAARPRHAPAAFMTKSVKTACRPGTHSCKVSSNAAIERHAAEYLDIVFSVASPTSIATWGLSDRYTWMRQYHKRADAKPLRPLPLDVNFNRKPLWSTVANYISI